MNDLISWPTYLVSTAIVLGLAATCGVIAGAQYGVATFGGAQAALFLLGAVDAVIRLIRHATRGAAATAPQA